MVSKGRREKVVVLLALSILFGVSSALNGPVMTVWENPTCSGSPDGVYQVFLDAEVAVPYGTCVNGVFGSHTAFCEPGTPGRLTSNTWYASDCSTGYFARTYQTIGQCFTAEGGFSRSYRCNDTDPLTTIGPFTHGGDYGVPLPPMATCAGVNDCPPNVPYGTTYENTTDCTLGPHVNAVSEPTTSGEIGVCYNTSEYNRQVYTECEEGIVRSYYYQYGCNGTVFAISELHFPPQGCEPLTAGSTPYSISFHCTPNVFPPTGNTPTPSNDATNAKRAPILSIVAFLALIISIII